MSGGTGRLGPKPATVLPHSPASKREPWGAGPAQKHMCTKPQSCTPDLHLSPAYSYETGAEDLADQSHSPRWIQLFIS